MPNPEYQSLPDAHLYGIPTREADPPHLSELDIFFGKDEVLPESFDNQLYFNKRLSPIIDLVQFKDALTHYQDETQKWMKPRTAIKQGELSSKIPQILYILGMPIESCHVEKIQGDPDFQVHYKVHQSMRTVLQAVGRVALNPSNYRIFDEDELKDTSIPDNTIQSLLPTQTTEEISHINQLARETLQSKKIASHIDLYGFLSSFWQQYKRVSFIENDASHLNSTFLNSSEWMTQELTNLHKITNHLFNIRHQNNWVSDPSKRSYLNPNVILKLPTDIGMNVRLHLGQVTFTGKNKVVVASPHHYNYLRSHRKTDASLSQLLQREIALRKAQYQVLAAMKLSQKSNLHKNIQEGHYQGEAIDLAMRSMTLPSIDAQIVFEQFYKNSHGKRVSKFTPMRFSYEEMYEFLEFNKLLATSLKLISKQERNLAAVDLRYKSTLFATE